MHQPNLVGNAKFLFLCIASHAVVHWLPEEAVRFTICSISLRLAVLLSSGEEDEDERDDKDAAEEPTGGTSSLSPPFTAEPLLGVLLGPGKLAKAGICSIVGESEWVDMGRSGLLSGIGGGGVRPLSLVEDRVDLVAIDKLLLRPPTVIVVAAAPAPR